MAFLSVNGTKIAYQSYPSGRRGAPVALLLHGLGSRSEDWLLQVKALTEAGYEVWTPDLRGLGDSSALHGWPTVEDLAEDMILLLTEKVRRPVHVVGLSLGGMVSLALAAKRPDLVQSLTLVNSFAHLPLRAVNWRNAWGRAMNLLVGSMQGLGKWVAQDLFPHPDQVGLRALAADRIAGNRRGSYLRLLVAVARFDLRSELGAIESPTLVVAGDQDHMVPMQVKENLAQGIPGARLIPFEGSGHATPIDAPQAFNERLLQFLELADGERGMELEEA